MRSHSKWINKSIYLINFCAALYQFYIVITGLDVRTGSPFNKYTEKVFIGVVKLKKKLFN